MPNRNPSESSPEYREMMAGLSPHKGVIEATPDFIPQPSHLEPSQLAESDTLQQQEATQPPRQAAPTFGDQFREWTSHLFGDRSE